VVSGDQSYDGDSIELQGNLTVTGTLTFRNVDLCVHGTVNGGLRIEVRACGVFNVLDSGIHSADPDIHFCFGVSANGTLVMNASELHDCGCDPGTDRGLLVESSSVSITNSTLTGNCEGVVVDGGAAPFIFRNNISANDYNGIEVFNGSAPVIDWNLIFGNDLLAQADYRGTVAGIRSDASSPVITNNTISGNRGCGIGLQTSGNPVIGHNDITGHRAQGAVVWGIISDGNDALIADNRIAWNDNGMFLMSGACTVEGNLFDNISSSLAWGGMAVQDTSFSDYRNDTCSGSTKGICPDSPSLATFTNETMVNCTHGYFGICYGLPEYDVVLTDCVFRGNSWDVTLDWDMYVAYGGHLTLVNASYNPNLVNILDPCGYITIKWYLQPRAVYENGSVPVEGATVKVVDAAGTGVGQSVTGPEGCAKRLTLEEYTKNGASTIVSTPYNVSAIKGDKANFTKDVALTASKVVNVTLDDMPPFIKITGPANGSWTNQAVITVTGRTEPRTFVALNGVDVPVKPDGTWSGQAELAGDGPNDITAFAQDPSMNQAQDTITVLRDTVAPAVMISGPREGFVTNRSAIQVTGKVSEPGARTTLDGVEMAVGENGAFSVEAELAEGPNSLLIRSRDAAGNVGTAVVNGELDTVPPALWVLAPQDGLATNASAVTVRGTAEDRSRVTVNNRAVELSGTGFSVSVELIEGVNAITVAAHDRAGNSNMTVLTVVRDSTAPALAILSPRDGEILNRTSVEVRGTAEAGAVVKVNGALVDLHGNEYSTVLELPDQQASTILVEASDSVRNTAVVAVTVEVDTVAPELKLRSPADGALTNLTSIELAGKTDAASALNVNGKAVPLAADGSFSVAMALEHDGANLITVVSKDRAGNAACSSVTVFRDTVLFYNVTSPAEGSKVKTASVTVTGNAEPASSVKVQGRAAALRADGAFSSEVALVRGPNTITVEIRDPAGNSATVTLNVTRAPQPKAAGKGFIPGYEAPLALACLLSGLLLAAAARGRRP
jgi:parallel beta-helix repeat protein